MKLNPIIPQRKKLQDQLWDFVAHWEKPVDELGKNSNETIQEERNINHSS